MSQTILVPECTHMTITAYMTPLPDKISHASVFIDHLLRWNNGKHGVQTIYTKKANNYNYAADIDDMRSTKKNWIHVRVSTFQMNHSSVHISS